jgi:ribose transport system substrate-binding protein
MLTFNKKGEMSMRLNKIRACLVAIFFFSAFGVGTAIGYDYNTDTMYNDGQTVDYYKALKGKTVAFVPLGWFDLTQGWHAAMKRQADRLGYKIKVRDPNWNVQMAAQALNSFISEKPDILIVHNLDANGNNRLLKKAMKAGITIIQINMKATINTDAYVGADWYECGIRMAEEVSKACGAGSGRNGKIAIIQGNPTGGGSYVTLKGVMDELKRHPEIKIVSSQAAYWDSTKANAITKTVIAQNPDLSGIIDFWGGDAIGTAAALKEGGMQDQVFLVTMGGGPPRACENISNGNFDVYFSYDVPGQGRDLNNAIKILLQNKPRPAGAHPFALYTPLRRMTKETVGPSSCWTIEGIKEKGEGNY